MECGVHGHTSLVDNCMVAELADLLFYLIMDQQGPFFHVPAYAWPQHGINHLCLK